MWQTLWAVSFFSFSFFAYAELPSSVGPAPSKDAQALLSQAKKSFTESRYHDAARLFQRFVDRHPAMPGYLDAHLYLGLTRIRLNQPGRAIEPLRYYVDATQSSTEGYRARLSLGKAYLGDQKFEEALVTTFEVLKKASLPLPIHLEALLLRTMAQMKLGQPQNAKKTLSSFYSRSASQKNNDLKSHAKSLEIQLKTQECSLYPTRLAKDEGTIRNQLKRRGKCLLEALLLYKDFLHHKDPQHARFTTQLMANEFQSYRKSCENPPAPKNLTKTQRKRFQEELSHLLKRDFQEQKEVALDLLESWKPGLPKSMNYYLNGLSSSL